MSWLAGVLPGIGIVVLAVMLINLTRGLGRLQRQIDQLRADLAPGRDR